MIARPWRSSPGTVPRWPGSGTARASWRARPWPPSAGAGRGWSARRIPAASALASSEVWLVTMCRNSIRSNSSTRGVGDLDQDLREPVGGNHHHARTSLGGLGCGAIEEDTRGIPTGASGSGPVELTRDDVGGDITKRPVLGRRHGRGAADHGLGEADSQLDHDHPLCLVHLTVCPPRPGAHRPGGGGPQLRVEDDIVWPSANATGRAGRGSRGCLDLVPVHVHGADGRALSQREGEDRACPVHDGRSRISGPGTRVGSVEVRSGTGRRVWKASRTALHPGRTAAPRCSRYGRLRTRPRSAGRPASEIRLRPRPPPAASRPPPGRVVASPRRRPACRRPSHAALDELADLSNPIVGRAHRRPDATLLEPAALISTAHADEMPRGGAVARRR